jgi:hypothetical protein
MNLIDAGSQLANIAFNLAQRAGEPLSQHEASLLDVARNNWDEARRAPTAPATLTDEQINYIGEQWDGCIYDAGGSGNIDIGAAVRAELKKMQAAPVTHNPHTGAPRDNRDIASDSQAVLCVAPGAPLRAATPAPAMGEELPHQQNMELVVARLEHIAGGFSENPREDAAQALVCARACVALRQPGAVEVGALPKAISTDKRFMDALDSYSDACGREERNSDNRIQLRLEIFAAAEAWRATPAAPVSQPAAQEQDWLNMIVRDVAELDYSSDTVMDEEMIIIKEEDLRRILERHTAPPPLSSPAGSEQEGDTKRLDYLETMVVNVRTNLRYGSRDLFWATPSDDDGDIGPSNIRAQIDAALVAQQKNGGQE